MAVERAFSVLYTAFNQDFLAIVLFLLMRGFIGFQHRFLNVTLVSYRRVSRGCDREG